MTPEQIEQQKMLLTLMGNVYGEAKKLDGNLVGVSGNLRPTSEGVKQMFEGALRSTQAPASPPPQVPQPQPQVSFPDAVNLPYFPPQQESTPVQLVDNSELVATLKGIEGNLAKLVDIFTQYEVKVKKATNRKVSRSSVEDQRPVHSESGEGQDIVDSELNGQYVDSVRGVKPFH
jgi:hypothetical protein